jgi:hypothetical protein
MTLNGVQTLCVQVQIRVHTARGVRPVGTGYVSYAPSCVVRVVLLM